MVCGGQRFTVLGYFVHRIIQLLVDGGVDFISTRQHLFSILFQCSTVFSLFTQFFLDRVRQAPSILGPPAFQAPY